MIMTILEKTQQGLALSSEEAVRLLTDPAVGLLDLLQSAYRLRRQYFGHKVKIHILNNIQNGRCPEDCHYCAQSKNSEAPIETYSMKPNEEILREAQAAFRSGAGRYCMVASGTGPTDARIEDLSDLIRSIKKAYPIEVCVSAGILNEAQARQLKAAGLDRLNHNLNTSEKHYGKICTSHTYADRLNTLKAAKAAGLAICSGVIVGMGETPQELVEVAMTLKRLETQSIPVNFFLPIPGVALEAAVGLTPEYCLRVLCLFRLLNPSAEIRMAAGRELHLRSLEVMGLYAANSLFLQGYLNAKGSRERQTLQMIKDAGFVIESEIPLDDLLEEGKGLSAGIELKSRADLRARS